MISSVKFEDFMGSMNCKSAEGFIGLFNGKSALWSSIEGFSRQNCTLYAGKVYGILSQFGDGGWAFAWSIGGRMKRHYDGFVYLDERKISPDALVKHACFVSENGLFRKYAGMGKKTVRECIEKALNENKQKISSDEIREIFEISPERYDRNYRYISGERLVATIAMGYAAGKDIFVFPWLPRAYRLPLSGKRPFIDFLREQGKIVVIPMDDKDMLLRICDDIIRIPDFTAKVI